MSGLNRYLIEDVIEDYQKLNTNPKTTTVDAGIVLEDAKGLPLILSVKDTTPPCDVDALTNLLDKHIRRRAQLIGKVSCEASAEVARARTIAYPGFDSDSLHAARDVFQRQADVEKVRWNQAKKAE